MLDVSGVRRLLQSVTPIGFNGMGFEFDENGQLWASTLGCYDTDSLVYRNDWGWNSEKHDPIKKQLFSFCKYLISEKIVHPRVGLYTVFLWDSSLNIQWKDAYHNVLWDSETFDFESLYLP